MKKIICTITAAALILTSNGLAINVLSDAPMPKENVGIAAKYPEDTGIENDPDVILADSFENYGKMSELRNIWYTINEDHMNLTTDSENVVRGSQSLQLNLPAQNIERYTGIDLYLSEEQKQDTIFIRYYQKIDESYAISNTTSNHNGGSISSRYWTCGDDSGPGICSDGTNKYLAMLQSTQSTIFDGHSMMVYTYHPDMRYNNICLIEGMPATPRGQQYADHLYPDGEVMPWTYWRGNYGDDFIPRPKFNIELGKWYCYELMLKANTPGQRDGRITAWVDGEIILDFGNMRFRDIADLKIDLVGFSFGCASTPTATKSWFDNIVIARSYIGPISTSEEEPLPNTEELDIIALKEYLLGKNDVEKENFDVDKNGFTDVYDLALAKKEALANAHIETEGKYLVDIENLPLEKMNNGDKFELIQTYINWEPETRVRKVGYGGGYYLYFHTIKKPLDDVGLSRQEIETLITEDEYNNFLKNQVGETIYKTRYQFYEGNEYVAVDVFSGDLEGLVFAEVEFDSVEKAKSFQPPSWFGKDVTDDKRYKNANLARNGLPE